MKRKLVYKDCWFTILNAHEIGVDNDGWDEGVFIPFKDANFYFVEKIRDGELAREELDKEWFE